MYADTIAPEAACTSVQLHQLVDPTAFARHWNAAQCIAGIQLAVGANSPFFYGRELWRETRIALFEQATDTRSEELKAQGVRPRVWFGERWITSIFDLFEENVRYFPSLLPVVEDEDPLEVLERGDTPRLQELRLHNGTIYRWNRPIYDVVRGRPHLRVENRVLPAGPTVVDTLANAAFYYGLVRVLADEERPLWTQMSFSAAEENFHACARDGIEARVYWPGPGRGAGGRAGGAAAAADGVRGARPLGRRRRRPRPAAGDHRAPLRRGSQRRVVAGRDVPQAVRAARPRRRAARDDRPLPRPDALERAGPHLGHGVSRVSPRPRAGTRTAMRLILAAAFAGLLLVPASAAASKRYSGCVAESRGCQHRFVGGDLPVIQFKDRQGANTVVPASACATPVHRVWRRPSHGQDGQVAPGGDLEHRRRRQAHRALVRERHQVARWKFRVVPESD